MSESNVRIENRAGSPTPLDPQYANLSRRRFLQATGFTFAGALVYGCSQAPEEELLPLLEQPEGLVPGRADDYATSCGGCSAGCGMLAKSRDGRPIKLEGNPEHPVSRGGLCAVGQASLLGLYDSHRFRSPVLEGRVSSWDEIDREMQSRIAALRSSGRVRYLSRPVLSPTKQAAIDRFLAQFDDGRHVVYEANSNSVALDAYERTHGVRAMPHVHLDRARLIVGVEADFLGRWVSPVEFTAQYASVRRAAGPATDFARHVQIESTLTLTGSKADQRFSIAPHETLAVLTYLARWISSRANLPLPKNLSSVDAGLKTPLDELAAELWNQRGRCVVLCGSDDVDAHVLCNSINEALGNIGSTLDASAPSHQVQGDESALQALLSDLEEGWIDGLFIDGTNPLLELPGGDEFATHLARIRTLVSFALRPDETTALAGVICPDRHFLESWGDVQPVEDLVGFQQPITRPLGDTRQVIESLAAWSGSPSPAREMLKARWGSDATWQQGLQDGFRSIAVGRRPAGSYRRNAMSDIAPQATPDSSAFELVLYSKIAFPDASHAFNPWLHELPDPVTKAVWDNYARLSPNAARELGVVQGDVLRVTSEDGHSIELPALVQAGQHDRVVAIALGYGAEHSRRFDSVGPHWLERRPTVGDDGLVGVSAAPLIRNTDRGRRFHGTTVSLEPAGRHVELALTQDYQSIDVPEKLAPTAGARRPNIREATIAGLAASEGHEASEHDQADLWPDDHSYTGHHWGMAIDLTTCTGCSACVIACQVENNVPVVGKDEVRRNREMHWIRIDRYFAGAGDQLTTAYQPMMCHQCDNAPCETVCPVLATVHSDEGLNQQVYNRCVGTRYCMNNCPYKVRRFNWFEYSHDDVYENLALNPDVTVRSRGVMEKCSFCAQRIHEAKARAKSERRELVDGDIRVACQQSCPAQAITFGDMNESESQVASAVSDRRHFRVLEELNVKPTVGYLSLVRNSPAGAMEESHGE